MCYEIWWTRLCMIRLSVTNCMCMSDYFPCAMCDGGVRLGPVIHLRNRNNKSQIDLSEPAKARCV